MQKAPQIILRRSENYVIDLLFCLLSFAKIHRICGDDYGGKTAAFFMVDPVICRNYRIFIPAANARTARNVFT